MSKYIKWFSDIRATDVDTAGGKNSSIGEMISQLPKKGVCVPNGFAVLNAGFQAFLSGNGLALKIINIYREFSPEKDNRSDVGLRIRNLIEYEIMPKDLEQEILSAYDELSLLYGTKDIGVAVRSSATVEDNPNDSFAGMFETFLNIKEGHALLRYIRECWASLFTDRSISYRRDKGYDLLNIGMSIGVQKMVRSDIGSSGVMFTLDMESGFRDVIVIQSAWGLGELVVRGEINPDTFYIFKPTGKIIGRELGSKEKKMICASGRSKVTEIVETSLEERDSFSLSDEEVLALARQGMIIEDHSGRPMDTEWAKDGIDDSTYIVQARPETVKSREVNPHIRLEYALSKTDAKILVSGCNIGQKIADGLAQVIQDAKDMSNFKRGNVLVVDITTPDWEPIMKQASAIVTNRGGRTCHAAIVARELGIPAVLGCADATKKLSGGVMVTVSCAEGVGRVYEGKVPFVKNEIDVSNLKKPKRTKIMLNIADPPQAFSLAVMYGDLVSGVGLLRLEIILAKLKAHPLAISNYAFLEKELQGQIDILAKGYASPREFYISKMAEGVGTIAAAFYPNDVIVRMSDFKSNEYIKLLGGHLYEPAREENPMLAWRGARRLTDPKFLPATLMEIETLRRVYYDMGLTNIKIMVPFVRTLKEGRDIIDLLAENGVGQVTTLCMCELPVNVLRAKDFLKIFSGGFSIGSNDLAQLTLGVSRDDDITGEELDERNLAVLALIKMAIEECNLRGQYSGICGQAPSDFPEITKLLVEYGITSISLNPDSVFKMLEVVAEAERELGL